MLLALFAMGVHSTFFGPIKYAILPQHLHKDEVLAGTGLVEAGTYIAILAGHDSWRIAMPTCGSIGGDHAAGGDRFCHLSVGARRTAAIERNRASTGNPVRASQSLITFSMQQSATALFGAWRSAYFWTIAAILFVQFSPLAKNVLLADKEVAAVLLVAFSAGIAIGSVSINALLKGDVSARYSARSVIFLGFFVITFYILCRAWNLTACGRTVSPWASFCHSRSRWH